MSDQNQSQQTQKPMTVAETIAMLSAKFDETKNQALQAISQLESQLISLSNKEKDK